MFWNVRANPQPGDSVRCEAVDAMRPALTVRERNRALLGTVQPAQTVEQARLARTVGTDQRLKGATTKRQGDVVESRHSPEAEREPVDANLGRSRESERVFQVEMYAQCLPSFVGTVRLYLVEPTTPNGTPRGPPRKSIAGIPIGAPGGAPGADCKP